MLKSQLARRALPPLLSREEMLNLILKEEYGTLPKAPDSLSFEVEENIIGNFCAGNAIASRIIAKCCIDGKEFSFPFYSSIPTSSEKHPFFVLINFRDNLPDTYLPVEELIDNGFAVLSFNYTDVTSDDGVFTNGLAGVLYPSGQRGLHDAGKLAMWAWASHRALDYAQGLDCLDMSRSAVCGHSRLGKAALLAAATDERFAFAYSNNSGCGGAAITRSKAGESIADICRVFPYWFCERYKSYVNNENLMPFDQHYLIASIAPRHVCVGSASLDEWADPSSEMLTCVAASKAYEKMGLSGFVCENDFAQIGQCFFEGSIGYHLREGLHYFSRKDWQRFIEFFKLHQSKEN